MTLANHIALNASTENVPAWLAGFGSEVAPKSTTVKAEAFAALKRAVAEGRTEDARDIRAVILQLGLI